MLENKNQGNEKEKEVMFCSHCGHQNPAGSRFCESCGMSLASKAGGSSRLKNVPFRKLASIGGALVIICFFLPWIMVSCSSSGFFGDDVEIKASGLELATGKINDLNSYYGLTDSIQEYARQYGYQVENVQNEISTPFLFVIPVLGLGAFFALSDKETGSIGALVCGIAGIIIMIIVTSKFHQIKEELEINSYNMLAVKNQIGFYLTWLGFLVQSILGAWGLSRK